jgi:di/tripeptidase
METTMPQETQRRTITPAEFAAYARENNVDVIYPSSYDPQLKGRAERRAMNTENPLLPIAKEYARVLEYLIRVDRINGDSEGASLKSFNLATVNAAIADAEGKTVHKAHAPALLAGRRYRLQRGEPVRR